MRSVKTIIALLLALTLLCGTLFGCASKGKPLMKLDDSEISVNVFELYLSRMKGLLCTTAYLGNSATKDDFWDTWLDLGNHTTYNEHYTDIVLETAKSHLAALALFEERGLELPKSYIDEIDSEMQELVDTQADGSKTAFNAIIGEYGVNYEMLREAYIIEAKIDYLQDDLFGEDGSKIGSSIIEEYCNNNYVRYKEIFLKTWEYEYEVDRNGDLIYFTDDGKISYDKTATAKKNDAGDYMVDEDGCRVYVYIDDDGNERIAYKKEGASRQIKTDSEGSPVVKYYNATEKALVAKEAREIFAQVEQGDTIGFDILLAESRNDNSGMAEYPNGYYVTKQTNSQSSEMIDELFEMEIGEVRLIEQGEYGYHIVMRYENEVGAYTKEANKNFFINDSGEYRFIDSLKGELLTEYLEPYKERIVLDEELYATVDIKRAGINYYY